MHNSGEKLKICMKKLKDYSFLKRFNINNECREPLLEKKCGKFTFVSF